MKLGFDILFSLIAIMIFCLPAVFISLAILLFERHEILFRQERIGKNKKPFNILKFRSMTNEIPTATGSLLRRTGLDEIPQFLNVLNGDMSIVGPRALALADIKRLKWDDDFHLLRWRNNPGITGLAQLYGGQHRKTSWFWDMRYLRMHSLLLDFEIVMASFLMNLFGKRKVRRIIFKKKNLK